MVQKRFLFIINPVSGRGKAAKSASLIRHICEKMNVYCDLRETISPGDASNIARAGLLEGFEAIVAVGGDGTVNEVGRELVGKNIPLGIVPSGSGNGLARHLRIPLSTGKAVRRVISGKSIIMDTGRLNDHVFLNVAGIGFDAKVSSAFAKSVRRGWYNYLKIIMRLVLNYKGMDVIMESASGKIESRAMMLSFANSSQFGNNAIIAPSADINDGKIDICLLKPIALPLALYFMLKLLTGNLRKTSYFDTFKASEIKVNGSGGIAHIDGDPVKVIDPIVVSAVSDSLHVIC